MRSATGTTTDLDWDDDDWDNDDLDDDLDDDGDWLDDD